MEINLTTPALLFPAISLLLLAYTNRFLAIANLIRKLHDDYVSGKRTKGLVQQIDNLRKRINYIRSMQALGIFSFLCCVFCMFCIYKQWMRAAEYIFALSLLALLASLLLSLVEIYLSTRALELEISDMEELENTNFFRGFRTSASEEKES
jgi:hypothetical protein